MRRARTSATVSWKGFVFFFQAEDGIRDYKVTGVQTCALPICLRQQRDAELRHVAWAEAMGVRENKQVSIALLAKAGDEVDFEIYSQEGEQGGQDRKSVV